ncbi:MULTISPECIES: CBS domain-containing protein [unclassified Brevundimonas]|jgi:CBS domain-containing protein|uniref:CBS domain-containing protein n=1 Tax=unclassified Brevundimonas TaxID=2622653 RepID=UPI00096EE83C|nr:MULTISPECIES: CBS domain-containing protein [unclassified Brevundimonas]NWE52837.1 CBS domain-containing protein [Brevundimonas sp. P7753]OMG60609.1 inosine-5-monophosphate dehydrogenase [Brevundimonas sp. ZS04]
MKVNECMSTDVQVCAPGDTMADAARMMKKIDAGFLPVGENDRLVGMITDRDLAVRGVAEDRGPNTPVRDIMSAEVLYCFDDESLDDVASQMGAQQVRRLPVLSRSKRLVGVISLGDISQAGGNGSQAAAALAGVTEPSARHSQH